MLLDQIQQSNSIKLKWSMDLDESHLSFSNFPTPAKIDPKTAWILRILFFHSNIKMDIQHTDSKPLQDGGGESQGVEAVESKSRLARVWGSCIQHLSYSWEGINVWVGPPQPSAATGSGDSGVAANVEKSHGSCCGWKREPSRQLVKNGSGRRIANQKQEVSHLYSFCIAILCSIVSGVVRPGELMAIMGASGRQHNKIALWSEGTKACHLAYVQKLSISHQTNAANA